MNFSKKVHNPEIPTSSMADIAFLLIVFFMLTTVFSASKGMEHLLPPKVDVPEDITPEEAIFIRIYPGGQFAMDNQTYSVDEAGKIYEYANAKIQANAKKPIIVFANREASYGDMVTVMDQLKQLDHDLEDVNLQITIPSKDEAVLYEKMGAGE